MAAEVTCSDGGKSVPIVVSADAIPHTDVTVTLGKNPYNSDESAGLTPDGNKVTLTIASPRGVLGFTCAANATGR